MFRYSPRHFPSPWTLVNDTRNGTNEGQWKIARRMIQPPLVENIGNVIWPVRLAAENLTSSKTKDPGSNPRIAGTPRHKYYSNNILSDHAELPDRSPHSTLISSANSALAAAMPRQNRQAIRDPRNDASPHDEPITGMAIERQIEKPIGRPVEANTRSLSIDSSQSPALDAGRDNQSKLAVSYILARKTSIPINSPDGNAMPRGLLRDPDAGEFKPDSDQGNDTVIRKIGRTSNDRLRKVGGYSGIIKNTHYRTAFTAGGVRPLRHAINDVTLVSHKAVPEERGSAQRDNTAVSTTQSSNVVGELWLDTLSLRDWLREYLSTESGRSSRAAHRIGNSVTDM